MACFYDDDRFCNDRCPFFIRKRSDIDKYGTFCMKAYKELNPESKPDDDYDKVLKELTSLKKYLAEKEAEEKKKAEEAAKMAKQHERDQLMADIAKMIRKETPNE